VQKPIYKFSPIKQLHEKGRKLCNIKHIAYYYNPVKLDELALKMKSCFCASPKFGYDERNWNRVEYPVKI
jgi:hypothetical protein